jgi:hypothetical protein
MQSIYKIPKQLFTICVDDSGYYTTENTENLVSIKSMPTVEDVKHLLAYRYNPDTEELQLDEERLAEINNEVANTPMEISPEERLIALENAFMELTAMTLGGGVNG